VSGFKALHHVGRYAQLWTNSHRAQLASLDHSPDGPLADLPSLGQLLDSEERPGRGLVRSGDNPSGNCPGIPRRRQRRDDFRGGGRYLRAAPIRAPSCRPCGRRNRVFRQQRTPRSPRPLGTWRRSVGLPPRGPTCVRTNDGACAQSRRRCCQNACPVPTRRRKNQHGTPFALMIARGHCWLGRYAGSNVHLCTAEIFICASHAARRVTSGAWSRNRSLSADAHEGRSERSEGTFAASDHARTGRRGPEFAANPEQRGSTEEKAQLLCRCPIAPWLLVTVSRGQHR
jgi:hypothetical protein